MKKGVLAAALVALAATGVARADEIRPDQAAFRSLYKELVETTDWGAYGRGKDPRCDNCMAHCGYEPSAVIASMDSLRQSLRALISTN